MAAASTSPASPSPSRPRRQRQCQPLRLPPQRLGGFINIARTPAGVFPGTFTAGGLELAFENGKLKIRKEGKQRKFVEKVGQISFSGQYAYDRGRMVLYVTERCVLRRVRAGLALIEVAPGIDIERDILAHMGFEPVIGEPVVTDLRIFQPEPMGLETHLLNLYLPDRIGYDPQRNILFLNERHVHQGQGRHRRAAPPVGETMQENRQAGRRVDQL